MPRVWFLAGGFLLVMLFMGSAGSSPTRQALELALGLVMLILMGVVVGAMILLVRRFRAEQQQVEGISELVRLRRWPEAAAILQQYLSRPARTGQFRTQAIISLAAVLARYHRFTDAIAVQEYLLEHELTDPSTAYGLRLGRVLAMLREDHLFDADHAIGQLRRITPPGAASAGLALVQIYRDVKTGHPAEAIELFERHLPALRDQLGHRVADAYALAARAYDLLGRSSDAEAAYEKATLLAPPAELMRRYPEVQKLQGRYLPTFAPPEAA